MENRHSNPLQNGGLGQNHPLRENFQNSSIKVLYRIAIDVPPNFMLICPVTKKCEFIVPVAKTPTLLTAILRPLGPGRQHFNT